MTETLSHAPIDNTPDQPASFTADQIQAQIDSLNTAEPRVDATEQHTDNPPLSPLDRVMNAMSNRADAVAARRTERKIKRAAIRAGNEAERAGADEEAIIDAMAAAIEAATPYDEEPTADTAALNVAPTDTEAESEATTSPSTVHPAILEEAYRLNDKYDQKAARQVARDKKVEARRDARDKKVEDAKQFFGLIGRITAQTAKRGFTTFADTVEGAAGAVGNKVETSISNGINWLEDAPKRKQAALERKQTRRAEREATRQEKAEERLQAQREREVAKQERITAAREAARQRANEAIIRKAERRQKWSGRKDRAVGHAVGVGRGARRLSKRIAKTATSAYAGGKEGWGTN